ncbi:protein NO VEIN domain-containing protein [Georgenia faecalis]|uniref:protein NO VEIN domain-containing protein n=1 Tax=Georgenia faecalis TaxID=2483799 RepID=UPI0013DFD103|nr:DUF3883 domain-containing protein [Georgenia faecalis]
MVLNIKLASRFDIDAANDTVLRRTWAGWDPAESEESLWEHNRGRYKIGSRAESERYATLSYGGTVRVVAEVSGRVHAQDPARPGDHWALIGQVLAPGHSVRDALLGTAVPAGRQVIQYLPDPDPGGRARNAFLLTNNPKRWATGFDEHIEQIEATAAGRTVEGRWSTGGRVQGIKSGDRAFLLRQGLEPRGIVMSGWFISEIFQQPHWREDTAGHANYADIEWDVVLDPQDALPLTVLEEFIPQQHWRPQGSGTQIRSEALDKLERLWSEHIDRIPAPPPQPPVPRGAPRQGWMRDPVLRKKVEDAAQDRLMKHYAKEGWEVVDTRYGNSFDARATKGNEVIYLEAKGTVTSGQSVIVTRGEVDWALNHPGQCVLGVLSDIRVTEDGAVDPNSGTFRLYRWEPRDDDLDPRAYGWTPSAPM